MSSIKISFSLLPPSNTQPPQSDEGSAVLDPSHVYTFALPSPVSGGSPGSSAAHYGGLQVALAEAKKITGADLTKWRDAVGDGEKFKEKTVKKAESESDEEGDGEEE